MNSLKLARHNQADGLGYCRLCGLEYTDAEVENVDHDPWVGECPQCHTEDDRILYWCNQEPDAELHAPSECERFHNES